MKYLRPEKSQSVGKYKKIVICLLSQTIGNLNYLKTLT